MVLLGSRRRLLYVRGTFNVNDGDGHPLSLCPSERYLQATICSEVSGQTDEVGWIPEVQAEVGGSKAISEYLLDNTHNEIRLREDTDDSGIIMLLLGIPIISGILAIISTLVSLRILSLLPDVYVPDQIKNRRPGPPIRIAIVLGSGGHTTEMIMLLKHLDLHRYTHRSYVISSGDSFSAASAQGFEKSLASDLPECRGSYDIIVVPRARKIHQSLWTTPFSSLYCLWSCLRLLKKPELAKNNQMYPDVIITNGPGTGVIVVLASYLIRLINPQGTKGKMRTVYVESWARVRRLSLSGRILLPLVNRFIVQWEALAKATGAKAEYLGTLV